MFSWNDPTAPVVVRPIVLAMASRSVDTKTLVCASLFDSFIHPQPMHRLLLMVAEKYASYFSEHKNETAKAPASLVDESGADGPMAWKVMTSSQTSKLIQLGISALR